MATPAASATTEVEGLIKFWTEQFPVEQIKPRAQRYIEQLQELVKEFGKNNPEGVARNQAIITGIQAYVAKFDTAALPSAAKKVDAVATASK